MKTLEQKIELVKNDLLTRIPDCSYTIIINLWDDGTDCVKCQHGTKDSKLCISTYYNEELKFEEIDIRFEGGVMLDSTGRTYYPHNTY